MSREITPKIYDEHVLSQGLQFQVDTYYEPKESSLKRRIAVVMDALGPKLSEKILDVGCGVGTFAFHSAKAGAHAVGIDYSKESINAAESLIKRFGLGDKSKFIIANATKLPFKGSSFDKIIASDFIEHVTLKEKGEFLSQMCRVLKAGGTAIIFTPNRTRERIGDFYWKIRAFLLGDKVPVNDLHFGLTDRREFEALLKSYELNFKLKYVDITRPYIARLPLIRNFLSLNLLWTIKKQ